MVGTGIEPRGTEGFTPLALPTELPQPKNKVRHFSTPCRIRTYTLFLAIVSKTIVSTFPPKGRVVCGPYRT